MTMDSDDENRTLYIGNLDKNVTEEILYELFLQAGPVDKVIIHYGKNGSYRYGFVTYKHECSVDYAIKLYTGTNLFKKELTIQRRNARSNNNVQQANDFNKYGALDSGLAKLASDFKDFSEQLNNYQQFTFQNLNLNPQPLGDAVNALKGNWCGWKKPYDREPRNHSSRSWDSRNRRKDRDYGNKIYHGRKNRHRD